MLKSKLITHIQIIINLKKIMKFRRNNKFILKLLNKKILQESRDILKNKKYKFIFNKIINN